MSRIRIFLAVILLITVGGFFFLSNQTKWGEQVWPLNKVYEWSFGLDLAGGSRLTYEADMEPIAEEDRDDSLSGVRDVIERRVNALGVSEPVVQTNHSGDNWRLIIELPGVTDVQEAIDQIGETPLLEFKTPGEPIELTEEQKNELAEENTLSKDQADEIFARVQAGEDFAELATEYSADGSAAQGGDLGFARKGMFVPEFEEALFDENLAAGEVVPQVVESQFGYHIIKLEEIQTVEEDQPILDEEGNPTEETETVVVEERRARHILFPTTSEQQRAAELSSAWDDTELGGKQLDKASVTFHPNTNEPQVLLQFDSEGKELFKNMTEEYRGQQIAIFLDGLLLSSPTVNEIIPNGEATISGGFTIEEARELARDLNAGALPVEVNLVSQTTVGATLSAESVGRSLLVGVIGLLLVAIFMLMYYRMVGAMAVVALAVYAILTLVLFKFIGITLTLAGIAGFILSIGLAVDANVLIFERMREELRKGRTLKDAVSEGFSRAWPSIRDANVSTLITCFILAWFGTSVIQGFAITLAVGTLVSMFTAITVTRNIILIAADWGWMKKMLGKV